MTDAEEKEKDAELFDERQALGYRKEGEWRGHKQFHCNHCPFDSLHEAVIRDHTIKRHQSAILEKAGVRKLSVPLFDGDGKKIEFIDVNDEEAEEDNDEN